TAHRKVPCKPSAACRYPSLWRIGQSREHNLSSQPLSIPPGPRSCASPQSSGQIADCCPSWFSGTQNSRSWYQCICKSHSISKKWLPWFLWLTLLCCHECIFLLCSLKSVHPSISHSSHRYLGCYTYD